MTCSSEVYRLLVELGAARNVFSTAARSLVCTKSLYSNTVEEKAAFATMALPMPRSNPKRNRLFRCFFGVTRFDRNRFWQTMIVELRCNHILVPILLLIVWPFYGLDSWPFCGTKTMPQFFRAEVGDKSAETLQTERQNWLRELRTLASSPCTGARE
jgi:hypothetical protein